ncbi:lysylphosphatidylglycerol synthase transmembrane domain-containing protein [Kitasatospora azatica]|uniref:lysylphosphatidylglycerol synthase transmembrane domain-containing protein n=1 Tax=Kitasatospora azatica TaxID=58347 RepID=UPI00068A05B4|nr:lysylphosphatidylglycerol synthase transmembrane domain-containing protein [Kitasatospora azatica]
MTRGITQTGPARWLRPRTLITTAGALAFAALLYIQGTHSPVDPVGLVLSADPAWSVLALLATAASYPAATMGFLGFVPERIGVARALLAQLAGSFVKLVAPGGFGSVALNTRLLLRAGIAPGPAASSVGASQLVGFSLHLLQLSFFLWLTGFQPTGHHSGYLGTITLGCTAAVALLSVALLLIPRLRRWALAKLRPLTEGSLTRLRQLLHHPRHLALGMLGQVLISMTLVAALYCCVRATGEHPRFAAVAVALLLGNTIGNVVPTPGGLGGVEAATAALLASTARLGYPSALAAVVLYRLITLVLPVLPGWAAFTVLQRRKAL